MNCASPREGNEASLARNGSFPRRGNVSLSEPENRKWGVSGPLRQYVCSTVLTCDEFLCANGHYMA